LTFLKPTPVPTEIFRQNKDIKAINTKTKIMARNERVTLDANTIISLKNEMSREQ
jgi:hypothetical protein